MNVLTQSTGVAAFRSEAAALETAPTSEKTAQTKHKMKLHTSAGRMVGFSQANGGMATGHGHIERLGTLGRTWSSTNWSISTKLRDMWSNSFTRIDEIILPWLNSLSGHSAAFDNAMVYLPRGEQTNGMLIISIFWWYWFRQSDPATTQRTREHLLGTMFAAAVGLFAARFLAATLPF